LNDYFDRRETSERIARNFIAQQKKIERIWNKLMNEINPLSKKFHDLAYMLEHVHAGTGVLEH
jgi:hypothetical protein